jgi:hypothetical protein
MSSSPYSLHLAVSSRHLLFRLFSTPCFSLSTCPLYPYSPPAVPFQHELFPSFSAPCFILSLCALHRYYLHPAFPSLYVLFPYSLRPAHPLYIRMFSPLFHTLCCSLPFRCFFPVFSTPCFFLSTCAIPLILCTLLCALRMCNSPYSLHPAVTSPHVFLPFSTPCCPLSSCASPLFYTLLSPLYMYSSPLFPTPRFPLYTCALLLILYNLLSPLYMCSSPYSLHLAFSPWFSTLFFPVSTRALPPNSLHPVAPR